MSFQDFFIPIVAFLIGTWAILTPPITRATDILAGVVFGIGFSSLVLSITFARNAYNKREKEVTDNNVINKRTRKELHIKAN